VRARRAPHRPREFRLARRSRFRRDVCVTN
jgi:hypothetical protein